MEISNSSARSTDQAWGIRKLPGQVVPVNGTNTAGAGHEATHLARTMGGTNKPNQRTGVGAFESTLMILFGELALVQVVT